METNKEINGVEALALIVPDERKVFTRENSAQNNKTIVLLRHAPRSVLIQSFEFDVVLMTFERARNMAFEMIGD